MSDDNLLSVSPALAVIVRTLGRSHLGDALDSLASQTRQDFETVIVDMSGGAAGSVIEVRKRHLPNLTHLSLGGRVGRSEALNLGVTRSAARAFAILDDDNLYPPTHVDTLFSGLVTTCADLVYTGVLRQTLTPDGRFVHEEWKQTPFDRDRLLFGNFIYATGTACRREIWQRVGGYDARFAVYEDWEFLIRVASSGLIAALPVISGISRSFTGDPARPSHHDEAEDCAQCAAGLFWTHRDKYTDALFDTNPALAGAHPGVPRGGTRREYEPLVEGWRRSAVKGRAAS